MEHIDKILNSLKQIWNKYPQTRLGQLLCSCFEYATLYEVGDERLINILSNKLKVELKDEPVEEVKPGNGTWNKGRIYVHFNAGVKAIKESELPEYLAMGYKRGRK